MKKILLIFAIIIFGSTVLFAQRGVGVRIRNEQGQNQDVILYQESYALVIGAIDYKNGWNKLNGVKNDVDEVSNILTKHGFKVEKVIDPTSENLLSKIIEFVNKYGFEENNRLLIYFAGHGYTETGSDGRKFGYIVPVDAPNPTKNLKDFQIKSLTMDEIENVARRIRSKHALFVFDSCFSGSLVSRSKTITSPFINYLSTQPVRQFITAGADNQTVPDQSVFRQMFVRGLEGEADSNKDGYITGTELAVYLQEKVIYYRGELQTPQYGKIRDPKLDRGDFIFVVSNQENVTQPIVIKPEEDFTINVEKQPKSTIRGNKSGKIYFLYGVTNTSPIKSKEVFQISSEFQGLLINKLKDRELTVLESLKKNEYSQFLGGINSRGDEKALRLLPVALVFYATIRSMEDLPPYQELYVSKVSGYFEIIDTNDNKTIGVDRFSEVRGFGNTREQARRNALRIAAEGISKTFLNLVKEKSR